MNPIQVVQWMVKNRFGIAVAAAAVMILLFLVLLHNYRNQASDLFVAQQNYAAATDRLRVQYLKDSTKEYAQNCYVKELQASLKAEAEREGALKKQLAIAKASIQVQPAETLVVANTHNDSTPGSCNVSWKYRAAGKSWENSIEGTTTYDSTKITKSLLKFDLLTGYKWTDKKHIEVWARSDCPLVSINKLDACIIDLTAVYPKARLLPWWAHEIIGAAVVVGGIYLLKKL